MVIIHAAPPGRYSFVRVQIWVRMCNFILGIYWLPSDRKKLIYDPKP